MSEEIKIREYEKNDEEKIVNLLQEVFEIWPHFDLSVSPVEHWKWKYQQNPLQKSVIAVAESNNRIVGCSHGYYLKTKFGNESLLAQQGVDLAVDKNFRGRGIHDKLILKKDEIHLRNNVNFTYSLSGNPVVYKKDLKKNRPRFPYQIQHMIKINNIKKHFEIKKYKDEKIKQYGYIFLKNINKISNYKIKFKPYEKLNDNCNIKEVKFVDKKFDIFWKKVKNHYNFITERDEKYFNWRFCDKRGGEYFTKIAYDNDNILGYIVYRINKINPEYMEGYIIDLLTLPNRTEIANHILIDIMKDFDEKNINIIHTLLFKNHPYELLFKKNNFIYDQRKLYLFYTNKNIEVNLLNEFTNSPVEKIHFMYSDLDWI
jgi:hypothetical protein